MKLRIQFFSNRGNYNPSLTFIIKAHPINNLIGKLKQFFKIPLQKTSPPLHLLLSLVHVITYIHLRRTCQLARLYNTHSPLLSFVATRALAALFGKVRRIGACRGCCSSARERERNNEKKACVSAGKAISWAPVSMGYFTTRDPMTRPIYIYTPGEPRER